MLSWAVKLEVFRLFHIGLDDLETWEVETVHEVKRVDGLFQTKLNETQLKNSMLNQREMEEGKTILESYPRRVLLELTNRCDLRCIMCARTLSKFTPTTVQLSILNKIDAFLRHAEEVTLFGWGEPTVNPNFTKFVERLSSYPNLRKYVLTNGTSLNIIKDIIAQYGLDILAVSLDGATANTNDSIRRGSSFDYIIRNLVEIGELQHCGTKIPYMNFVFVAMKRNIHELPEMVKLAHSINIPEVKCVYLTAFTKGLEKQTMWHERELCRKYFEIAKETAKKLNISLKLPHYILEDPAGDLPHKPCYVPWRDLFIGSDECIRPCQSSSLVLANINDYDNVYELWNSENFQKMRATVNDETKMPDSCKFCYQSSHANWNKEYAHIQTGYRYAPEWGAR